MARGRVRVVLDTNVLVSAIIFLGKPRHILKLVSRREVISVISPALISELLEVLTKKFLIGQEDLYLVEKRIRNEFILVNPQREVKIARDRDDNRVLEAAVEGECRFVVTGDKDLLDLRKYKHIQILTPSKFLAQLPT